MISLSLRGLVKYMLASPAAQRKVLHDFKYPKGEGKAQAKYYRDARNCIRTFHEKGHGVDWLAGRANALSSRSDFDTGQRASRLRNNARAVRDYAAHFSEREFCLLPNLQLDLLYDPVRISVAPDLHVTEAKREKIIRLEFAKDGADDNSLRIMSQCMFEAASQSGLNLSSSCVLCFDVSRGSVCKGARIGARMASEIRAATANIAALWDTI